VERRRRRVGKKKKQRLKSFKKSFGHPFLSEDDTLERGEIALRILKETLEPKNTSERSPVFLIAAGAGTGKTHCVSMLLDFPACEDNIRAFLTSKINSLNKEDLTFDETNELNQLQHDLNGLKDKIETARKKIISLSISFNSNTSVLTLSSRSSQILQKPIKFTKMKETDKVPVPPFLSQIFDLPDEEIKHPPTYPLKSDVSLEHPLIPVSHPGSTSPSSSSSSSPSSSSSSSSPSSSSSSSSPSPERSLSPPSSQPGSTAVCKTSPKPEVHQDLIPEIYHELSSRTLFAHWCKPSLAFTYFHSFFRDFFRNLSPKMAIDMIRYDHSVLKGTPKEDFTVLLCVDEISKLESHLIKGVYEVLRCGLLFRSLFHLLSLPFPFLQTECQKTEWQQTDSNLS